MKRFPILGSLLLIPAIALLALTGCPGPKVETDKKDPTPAVPPKTTTKTKIKTPTDGKFAGTVTFKGEKPAMPLIDAIAKHQEKAICEAGGQINVQEQNWIIDKDNGVANVVVWLEPAADKEFDIKDEHKAPFKKPAEMDQPFCQYVPHVVAVYADFQPLVVKNSSKTLHNVKIEEGRNNPKKDINMPKEAKPIELTFKKEPVGSPLKFSCSIHTWMSGRVLTFDHPYFAVTDKNGKFEIANVPNGEDLAVWMWHEEKGKWKAKDFKFVTGANDLGLTIAK